METSQIAIVGNHLPRKCGIATFTTDLCDSLVALRGDDACFTVAISDSDQSYAYPERVRFEIREGDPSSYRRAADFLNLSNVETICLQHEFGIFGGTSGSYILRLLREVRAPVVTTLHTVLREPTTPQRQVLEEVARLSDRLVVMSGRAVDYLREIYQIPADKIDLIPHGIPDTPFVDSNFYKDQYGLEGKTIILTFGLLSPNKGIEHAIRALPMIVEHHPDVVYMVLGATHPNVIREQGEAYRESLVQLARDLGVTRHVMFIDEFVSLERLMEYIGAADIYVTPYLNEQQIVSGTLAYATGAGKAVVSTPYWYAEELLAEGRGLLTPFGDADKLAAQVTQLLEHDVERHAIRKRAYMNAREMIWPEVGRRYLESFEKARDCRHLRPTLFSGSQVSSISKTLPALNLQHLLQMTDNTGMLQHATYSVPNYSEGYSTDDNARALAFAVMLDEAGEDRLADVPALTTRYMAFLWHSYNPETGQFRNFMGFDRRWLEDAGSPDCNGRVLHALGVVLGRSRQEDLRGVALRLFEAALPTALEFTDLRPIASSILGISEYLRRFSGDRAAHQVLATLTDRLWERYRSHASPTWPWFEPQLTYCNAVLPHALLVGSATLGDTAGVTASLRMLKWLISQQRSDAGDFMPIGCNGFYPADGPKARFDQQPVEAQGLIEACLAAWRITRNGRWREDAHWVFSWFMGQNDLGLSLYDPRTGACHDGLQPDRINNNQGAESTLAFLTGLLQMRQAQQLLPSEVVMPALDVRTVNANSDASMTPHSGD